MDTKNRIKQLTCLATMLFACIFAQAQKDITAQYLQNPSFESDKVSTLTADATRGAYSITKITNWTLTGVYGVSDIMTATATATDNNLGAPGQPSDGQQMYYIRHAWTNGSASLTQTVTLPAGKYRFAVDSKSATPGTSSSGRIVANGEQTTLTLNSSSIPSAWKTEAVDFTLATQTEVTLGFNFTWVNSAGASFLLDNCRLLDMSDYVEPKDPTESEVSSFTEGVINNIFVPETEMKADLLQMLANFSKYLVNDFQECQAPNSLNELCGCFKGENTMANDERGVRPNADLSMICAFLIKYGKPAGVTLPSGVTWAKIEDMAMKSLVFAYSTHKANKLKVCSGNNYWGSVSNSDHTWESSLWAMSVAYSAFFQWDKLSEAQKGYIYAMMKAECNYELERGIPTGYAGDTKAEENGWEVDILAATLGLFPNDPLAPRWFERMREFAINSYSHPSDATNTTIIDPEYDNKTIADLYKGQNLYDDYSLQNHNLFHTSYQNVVMQELGEAALALKMFQLGVTGEEKWKSNALMHHNQEVQDSILNWLALADGELAMPNGNDWSLFLYDQITSYTTQACFLKDCNALMLENLAYKYIKARQNTTTDGSWLLRADVGARRMGVEAHRVMMTYLMHDVLSTSNLTPTDWNDFRNQFSEAKMLPCQNIVRAYTPQKFSCFSWSNGLKSYTGYFTSDKADMNKIIVPYRANNTGNIIGWYEVSGKGTNAEPVVNGIYQLKGNGYVMNGELNTNDKSLNNRFVIYSTPGNALIYLDYVTANSACTITAEKGGMLAISTDELMKTKRTLYYNNAGEMTHKQLDGSQLTTLNSDWVNIDNEVSVINLDGGKKIAFGDRGANNSIFTSKLYPMYNNTSRSIASGSVVDSRALVYYQETAEKTAEKYTQKSATQVTGLPEGWNGADVADDVCNYFIVANFKGVNDATLIDYHTNGYAPVFNNQTTITDSKSTVNFTVAQNNSYAQALTIYLQGTKLTAKQTDEKTCYVSADSKQTFTIRIANGNGGYQTKTITIQRNETLKVYLNENNEVCAESAAGFPETEEGKDCTEKIINPTFDGNTAYGWSGTTPAFQSYTNAEFYNKTFDFYQVVTNLQPGVYEVCVQAFYRDGAYTSAATNYNKHSDKKNAELHAITMVDGVQQDSITLVKSIFDDANMNYRIGVNTVAGYIPDNMEQAASYFRKGLYQNTVKANVGEDGTLKIQLKKTVTTASDWTCFDNFTLTYLGKEDPTDIKNIVNPSDRSLYRTSQYVYTLGGIRANANEKGIVIQEGKKFFRK